MDTFTELRKLTILLILANSAIGSKYADANQTSVATGKDSRSLEMHKVYCGGTSVGLVKGQTGFCMVQTTVNDPTRPGKTAPAISWCKTENGECPDSVKKCNDQIIDPLPETSTYDIKPSTNRHAAAGKAAKITGFDFGSGAGQCGKQDLCIARLNKTKEGAELDTAIGSSWGVVFAEKGQCPLSTEGYTKNEPRLTIIPSGEIANISKCKDNYYVCYLETPDEGLMRAFACAKDEAKELFKERYKYSELAHCTKKVMNPFGLASIPPSEYEESEEVDREVDHEVEIR